MLIYSAVIFRMAFGLVRAILCSTYRGTMMIEAPSVARRTWALALTIMANVVWSYCVMHLGRFSTDAIADPALWVALPCYAGYVTGALPFLLRPGLLDALMRSQGWPVTVAVFMSLVSVMLAFSPIQTAFPTGLFVVLANFFRDLYARHIKRSATYRPSTCCPERPSWRLCLRPTRWYTSSPSCS